MEGADVAADVAEPERSDRRIGLRFGEGGVPGPVPQGSKHQNVEYVDPMTQLAQSSADRPYPDRRLAIGGYLSDELVEFLPDRHVLGEQVIFQLPARGLSEVGVDQGQVPVQVVVPDSQDRAIVGQFGVQRGGLARPESQPLRGPEDEAHPVQALVEQSAELLESLERELTLQVSALRLVLVAPCALLKEVGQCPADDTCEHEPEKKEQDRVTHISTAVGRIREFQNAGKDVSTPVSDLFRACDSVIVTAGPYAYRRQDGIAIVPAALLGP